MIPQVLSQKIINAEPLLVALKKSVADTLTAFADTRNFPLSGRIKTAESVAEKIEMGRYLRFSEIDDLVAFNLIIPSAAYEQEVISFCKSSFEVVFVRSKTETRKAPDVFRFDSTRIVAKARRPPDLVGHTGPAIYDYLFEIQVRTAFEHAWSVATHDLVYKASSIDWKRVRLAAQLKATSEGLDAAVAAFDHLAMNINESPWERVSDQTEVSKFVSLAFENSRLPPTLRPASISRFSENFWALITSIQPRLSITDALRIINEQMTQTESMPMSLSLYQLFLGMLCRDVRVTDTRNIHCHVTAELVALFPETARLNAVFDYES